MFIVVVVCPFSSRLLIDRDSYDCFGYTFVLYTTIASTAAHTHIGIWSDPASEEQEMTSVDPDTGYGESLRGGGAICFGNKAVTDFLSQQDFSYIMRAHEAHAEGVAVSKGARVFTVFSTSQDHNQGSHAMAGCMLVDNDKLQVINRSPACKFVVVCCYCSLCVLWNRRFSLTMHTAYRQESVCPPPRLGQSRGPIGKGNPTARKTWLGDQQLQRSRIDGGRRRRGGS